MGTAAGSPAQRPPPAAALEKPLRLRSEAVGAEGAGGGDRSVLSRDAGLRCPCHTRHFPCWPVMIVPGCGAVVFISSLPPRDNNGHCVCPACPGHCPHIVSFHPLAQPEAGGGQVCPFSGQAAVCGRHPSRQDPEGVSPLGRGTFLHLAGPLNLRGLPADAPGFPIPVSTIPRAASPLPGSLLPPP